MKNINSIFVVLEIVCGKRDSAPLYRPQNLSQDSVAR